MGIVSLELGLNRKLMSWVLHICAIATGEALERIHLSHEVGAPAVAA